ncbi:Flp family type IVb pilin [Bradyrhizobium sp. CCBAU 45394]|uniref:Flp family type IVb pilin n=1 Tax=Bradyrhizobium sp. CCBAU 45394 TaxID=1325087 RepID=UPI002FE00654
MLRITPLWSTRNPPSEHYKRIQLAQGFFANDHSDVCHLQGRDPPMLTYYIETREALKRLRTDQDGVVSFEYIIVAVCIIGAVSAVFGGGATGKIGAALTTGITAITDAFAAAV